jgi:serine/threonine protein kinase
MSTVYRAYDHRTAREVAVKVFRPGVDLHAEQRYRREVQLLSSLHDPGLVAVLDADLGYGTSPAVKPFLVTELVDGPTLSQRIRNAPLEEAQVAQLGAALCRTLAYVHDHGIVHRDVKPSNILLNARTDVAEPKLVDFGIAIAEDDTRLTTDDMTVGTANYLSPEQVRGEPVTPASDIYSLGLALIVSITGRHA